MVIPILTYHYSTLFLCVLDIIGYGDRGSGFGSGSGSGLTEDNLLKPDFDEDNGT